MAMADFITTYGLAFIFLNVLLDQMGLPIPALPTLIVAGALSLDGKISLPGVFLAGVGATLLTEVSWYYAGRRYGGSIMKTLCRVSLTPDLCVQQTQNMFERWGTNALIFANFIPGLAVIAPPLAGATRTGWARFLLLSVTGACLWIGTCVGIGMVFKGQVNQLLRVLTDSGEIVITVILLALAAYIGHKWWERKRFFAMLRMARINVDELYRQISEGAAPVVVDVRSQTARALEPRQIPGALHLPLHSISRHVAGLPRDREVIFYCTCPNEVSAVEASKILMNSGFKRVRPLHGGLEAWIAAGYSIEDIEAAMPPPPDAPA